MRSILLALCALLVAAAPAAADYTRVAPVRPDDDIALAGAAVVVGSTPAGGVSTLALHGLDGSVRPIAIPRPSRFVEELNASASALAALTLTPAGGADVGYYGPVGGPLRRLPSTWIDVAVTGDTVVSLHSRGQDHRGWLELRNVRTGTLRRIALRGERVAIVTAAGDFAAYAVNFASPRETTVVVDLRTGRERYRVRTPRTSTAYRLAPNGRVWFVVSAGSSSSRVMTATRGRPRPRTVARLPLQPYELAAAAGSVAVASSGVVLVRPDGQVRTVTPDLPGVTALAYDGATLAFGTANCVFAGPPPVGAPPPLSLAECGAQLERW